MYIVDDIAYASEPKENIKVTELKVITDLYLLLTFSNGEMKVYDATELLKYPAYEKLKDFSFFKQAYIENGVVMWGNGEIDISPEEMYEKSFSYEKVGVS